MEKNCLNCKYYYKSKCNNNLTLASENNIKDITIKFIEEGILMELLKESLLNEELKRIFLKNFIKKVIEKGYIKKNKIDNLVKDSFSEDEEDNEENEIIEKLEYIISDILLKNRYFQNSICNIIITEPHTFYCKNWE